jgi:hypothetical protein
MSLRDRLKNKNPSLVKRVQVLLPDAQETVQVRSLMLGEKSRIGEKSGFAAVATMIALGLEDPDTNQPMYNPNSLDDHNEIALYSGRDSDLIVETMMEISGMGEKGKKEVGKASLESGSSGSSSQPVTVFLPPVSEES